MKVCHKCNRHWNPTFKYCPDCGTRIDSPLDQLLTYLKKNEKLSVTSRKKGKWGAWVKALETLMRENDVDAKK